MSVQSMRIFILNNLEQLHEILKQRYPVLVNRNRVLLQQDILQEEPRQKFRNWKESNCHHTQHTALILRLQITICFQQCPFLAWKKFLKLQSCGSGSHRILRIETRDWYRCGVINLAERWLKTTENDGLYSEE